ncbi:MAG: hypothetical protein HY471_00535 [Candidatus Sungbacteria bacterium]|nr:hypothetical protein [Candidatus Sungbacteria bacterium]
MNNKEQDKDKDKRGEQKIGQERLAGREGADGGKNRERGNQDEGEQRDSK